jgi:hypothetical protein
MNRIVINNRLLLLFVITPECIEDRTALVNPPWRVEANVETLGDLGPRVEVFRKTAADVLRRRPDHLREWGPRGTRDKGVRVDEVRQHLWSSVRDPLFHGVRPIRGLLREPGRPPRVRLHHVTEPLCASKREQDVKNH